MANRFPLIVNPVSKKIEELSAGDNIDLSSNGIYASGSTGGAGQYLKSSGSSVIWDSPGDVYLSASQTLTNKTFANAIISGLNNNIYDIPNTSLLNDSITINGTVVPLGGSFSFPADTNTTYAISLVDGADATRKSLRLTGINPSSTDDISFKAGQNVTISRLNDEITFNSSYVDTITRLRGSVGGTYISGDITITASGSSVVTQNGDIINISSSFVDTITRLKGEAAGTFASGDITFLQGGATTVSQSGSNITISSLNTITRVKGGATGTLASGDITILGTNATSVSQAGNTVTVDSTNTVTRLQGGSSGTPVTGDVKILTGGASSVTQSGNDITVSSVDTITRVKGGTTAIFAPGDFTIVGAGAADVTQSGNTITVTGTDTDTVTRLVAGTGTLSSGDITIAAAGACSVEKQGQTITITSVDTDTNYTAGIGLTLTGTEFTLKNQNTLITNRLTKWNTSSGQLVNSNITDDGTSITIGGNLIVNGTTTTINTTTLVVNDNEIELRNGNSIIAASGGIKLNRTTDSSGAVTAYQALQWFESGGYWRSFDGVTSNRFVTEDETQTLKNKTLFQPTLQTPVLGIATATTINKVAITQPATGATLSISEGKTFSITNTLTFSGNDLTSISFGSGGTVAYTANKLSAFAATTSDEFRGIISDETGTGKVIFATTPTFTTGVLTGSTIFGVFNTVATTINAFGAATTINIGAATGNTNIKNNLVVEGNATLGNASSDVATVIATTSFTGEDITVRGIVVGRGASGVTTNTALGKESLRLVVGSGVGASNTALGYETLYSNQSGSRNTVVGFRSGKFISSGDDNISVGSDASSTLTIGIKNTTIGTESLYNNIQGGNNVCIGYKAGYTVTGSGNVVIGSASNGTTSDVTYQLPNPTGNNQLVIGSGGGMWLRGDSNFDIIFPNNVGVLGTLTIGSPTATATLLNINSRTLTVQSSNVSFVDKELVIGNATTTAFKAQVVQGNTSITITEYGTGIIPGMVVVSQTDGITVPSNTTIASIDEVNSIIVLSAAPNLGSGVVTFAATGPSNTSANLGGIRLKGTTDKTFLWSNANTAWQSNQSLDLNSGLIYKINNVSVLSSSTLGTNVVNSSLTSVGTLNALSIANSGTSVGLTITNTGTGDCLIINDEESDTTPFRIDNAGNLTIGGNLVIGTSGKGIDFSANANTTGMTSELLDDYEEGTFTPFLNRTDSSPSVTYTERIGTYTKIGKMVYVFYDITASSISGGSGAAAVGDLPFNVSTSLAGYSVAQYRDASAVAPGGAGTALKGFLQRGAAYIFLQYDNTGTAGFATNTFSTWNGSGRITGYAIYETDS